MKAYNYSLRHHYIFTARFFAKQSFSTAGGHKHIKFFTRAIFAKFLRRNTMKHPFTKPHKRLIINQLNE